MRYCITGAAGNISKPLALHLLKTDHHVRVIGRNHNHLKELEDAGAETAIGSVEDVSFLKRSFSGVDAVYTMCPPNFMPEGFIAYAEKIGKNYREAIAANKIAHVVNLSSVGAHLPGGTGHITGMYKIEQELNELQNVNIFNLRPVYFYTNFFSQIDMIRNLGIMGSNFSMETNRFPIVHPSDIATVAAQKLQSLDFQGINTEYIASDERSTSEIASVLGKAISKPDLKWTKFADEQMLEALIQSGIPQKSAQELTQGFHAIDTGKLFEHYWANHPTLQKQKLEDFASQFAQVYAAGTAVYEQAKN